MFAQPPAIPTLDVISVPPPGSSLNEDAWLVMQSGDQIVVAVIDGATTRLTPPPLQRYLDTLPGSLTPAAFSARLVRDSLAQQIAGSAGPPDARALVLEANAALGRVLTDVLGALTLEHMAFPPEVYNTLAHDPRLVRFGLPASVITLAVYDPDAHALTYAQAGDTLLVVVYEDGHVSFPTRPDVARTDSVIKEIVQTVRERDPDASLNGLLTDDSARRVDMNATLRHNYVDEHGLPQPSQGVGVLNGLPELRYFLKTGQVSLDRVVMVGVLSDGLEWPTSARELLTDDPDEATALMHERREFWAHLLYAGGLRDTLRQIREAEAADADHEQYPRIKTHDDATGVLLRFA